MESVVRLQCFVTYLILLRTFYFQCASPAVLATKATSYESVVLSPENFSRFNDDILQACLLRATLPSELDYSSSPELSGPMRELIANIFDRWHHVHGAAALEFALALLSGRMPLMDSDLIRLRKETLAKLVNDDPTNPLLGLVHLLDQQASLA